MPPFTHPAPLPLLSSHAGNNCHFLLCLLPLLRAHLCCCLVFPMQGGLCCLNYQEPILMALPQLLCFLKYSVMNLISQGLRFRFASIRKVPSRIMCRLRYLSIHTHLLDAEGGPFRLKAPVLVGAFVKAVSVNNNDYDTLAVRSHVCA